MMALIRETKDRLSLTGTILINPVLIGLWIFACPSVWAASSQSESTDKIEGNSEEGRKIYNGKGFCYECHGYEGYIERRPQQMEPELRRLLDKLDPKPADFRNPATLQSKNDQERFDTIRRGHSGTNMFPKKFLSDTEINSIVAYLSVLRSEGKGQGNPGRENRK
jgi:mono/diheme cytochrome c family protein